MNWEEISNEIETLDPDRLAAIRDRVVAGTSPVKPLPSDGTLIGLLAGGFAGFAALAGYLTHMSALHVLSGAQMTFYYGVILICAVEGASVIVGEMIPGSGLRPRRWFWVGLTITALPLVCWAIFDNYDMKRFERLGMPCFMLGSVTGLIAGVLLALFVRRGFVARQRSAARAVAIFAGLTGFGVLALHCPFLSIPHILVWHFGVVIFGWLIGDLIGWRLESR